MALTFSIGGSTFAALAGTAGNYAMAIDVDSPQQAMNRFHVQGSDGNYLVRGGRAGIKIRARFRYVNTLANVMSAFASAKAAWANAAVEIVAPEATFTRCSLEPGGMKIVREPIAKGDGTNVFMDVEAVFTSDA